MYPINPTDYGYEFADPSGQYLARQERGRWAVLYFSAKGSAAGYGDDLATAMLSAECGAFIQYWRRASSELG
ncbi:hypothetical protein [Leptolyngbya sp. FACHB-261]|uniref:hypothetical protein n=1 Tax=Leptolyngbya sp. FACHB-261 TaxID=2692806 RepID=UPI0016883431|nr:hypothetical protein [Leptolyngbya sp. FACHB-261]MBD2104733.1 hypothetical protein [Leptolyngbya sp. FACHB-261]